MDCLIGVRNAILPSLALWALVILGVMALAGCSNRHDDGMGDLWKGVKYVQEQRR